MNKPVNLSKEDHINLKCLSIIFNKSMIKVISGLINDKINSDALLKAKVDELKKLINFDEITE